MEISTILMRHKDSSCGHFDMQMIGTFLSFASRGDRVGLNQMLRRGISPNVQDYDKRTALHLAASEGHASIVELLLAYKADVNLKDRWRRTPLTDAKLYGHRDICRILEVCGGKDSNSDHPLHSSIIEQGLFGESEKVKWRGTWVVKTVIKRVFSAKVNTLLRELRHPNILQFLGSIVHGDEMILITEYLPKGNMQDILRKRLDPPTALRYALDIARGMNYLHRHKPLPIVHNNLHLKNLLLDECGHLKIGEYWVQILDNQIYANQDCCQTNNGCNLISHLCHDISKDIYSFGLIFYQMLEGRQMSDRSSDSMHIKSVDLEKKMYTGRYPSRILQLIEDCTSTVTSTRPSFATVIEILEEVSLLSRKTGCPPCNKSKSPK
ncbi:serine/threonine-protein kinase 12-like isoform X2 [Solanum lycopersicum]|uniref:serine/threonine-protein kinase 12-like isoform X2 n=1 Tax=Solanum lycopersicum TaxID=4081 RepID=UPI000532B6D5|nr:integrin-linked protein kinase 1-like isoform X2 [Solanum lycopersicum]